MSPMGAAKLGAADTERRTKVTKEACMMSKKVVKLIVKVKENVGRRRK